MASAPTNVGQTGSYLPQSPYQITTNYGDAKPCVSNTGSSWFGPLNPLAPLAPPEVAGRQFDYPSGFDLATPPPVYEPISFCALRDLAAYDVLRTAGMFALHPLDGSTVKPVIGDWGSTPRDPNAVAYQQEHDDDLGRSHLALEGALQHDLH